MQAQAAALRQTGLDALKAGRLEEAVKTLQQAVGADPEDYDTVSYLAAAYAQQGNYESARRAFGRAVQIQPHSAKARFNLGTAHQMAGDTEAARVCFEATLQFDPGYAAARESLAQLPPKVVKMSDLAAPGGAIHLPGAHSASLTDNAPEAPKRPLTQAEIAKLSAPQGHIHLMGAQAPEEDHGKK